jgi:hypothetical protein
MKTNYIKTVLFPLLYTLWRFQLSNHPGIDFCIKTRAGNTIECGVTQFASNGLILSRTLYRQGDPDSAFTEVSKFDLPGLVSWARNAVSMGGTISPGTYQDQAYLIAA